MYLTPLPKADPGRPRTVSPTRVPLLPLSLPLTLCLGPHPSTLSSTQPSTQSSIQPSTLPSTLPSILASTQSSIQSSTQHSVLDPALDSNIDPPLDSTIDPIIDSNIDPTIDPPLDSASLRPTGQPVNWSTLPWLHLAQRGRVLDRVRSRVRSAESMRTESRITRARARLGTSVSAGPCLFPSPIDPALFPSP